RTFFSTLRHPPTSTLFPSTPLFRSHVPPVRAVCVDDERLGGNRPLNVDARAKDELERARRGELDAGGVVRHGSAPQRGEPVRARDRKSTRLNSSHRTTSYAVFCLQK